MWNRASRVEAELGTSAHMGVYASNERERQASPPTSFSGRGKSQGGSCNPKRGREGALGAQNRAGVPMEVAIHHSTHAPGVEGAVMARKLSTWCPCAPPPRPLPTLQLRPFL